MKLQRKKTSDRVHARDLRQPTAFCSGAVGEWKGKCRLKAKWLAEQDDVTVTSSKITNDITGDEYSMQIEHCVELGSAHSS